MQPRPSTKAKPNMERAGQRPAHLLNRGAAHPASKPKPTPSPPDSVSTNTANPTPPARPANLTKQQKGTSTPVHLQKGKQSATAASRLASLSPPASHVGQWLSGIRSGAPSEAGGVGAQSEDGWDDAAEKTDGKVNPTDENTKAKATNENPEANITSENVQINGGGVEEKPALVWGQSPAPSERDDAQSEDGWGNVSRGESQWPDVGGAGDVSKRNQSTSFVGPSHAAAPVRDDAASVSGWSNVSKGADVWPEYPKDDDAVSVASTVGPANTRKHAAASDAKAKGKGNTKNKNKNKNKKNQNQVQAPPPQQQQQQQVPAQNAGRAAVAAGRGRANNTPFARAPAERFANKAPVARASTAWSATTRTPGAKAAAPTPQTHAPKPTNATPSTPPANMSWADQMDADDDGRSVASQGWSRVQW